MSEGSWRGKVGGMSEAEQDAFLARGKTMRLSCLVLEVPHGPDFPKSGTVPLFGSARR